MQISDEINTPINRPEPKWARALASVPEWGINVGFASLTIPAAVLGFVETGFRNSLIGLIVFGVIAGAALSWMKHARDKDMEEVRDQALSDAIEKDQQAYKEVIEEMSTSVYHLSSVLGLSRKAELEKELSLVRQTVLEIVRHRLGPKSGVQANLFTVSSVDPPELTADKWGSAGGKNGQTSDRIFSPGDATYDMAINKLSRFVPDVSELEDDEQPARPYKTFATHPVSTDEHLYGILTIDAPNPNDISELDVGLLAFFAGILSATFAAEKEPKSIPRR